jgi:hypothetical protein
MRPQFFDLFCVVTIASALASAGGTTVRKVHKLPEIPPIFVEKPFATPKALTAFRDYVARVSVEKHINIQVPPDFYTAAPMITYWGYEFEENASGTYDVVFTQKFDVSSLFSGLMTFVSGLREDNCSNWHVTGVSITRMAAKEIDVAGAMQGTEMACTHIPFDGDAKTKVGDIEGNATGRLTFHVDTTSGDANGRYRGAFLANDPQVSAQGKAKSVFGINTDSVLGQVITAVGHLAIAPVAFVRNPTDSSMWESINIFNGNLWRAPSEAINDVVFAISNHGNIEFSRYKEFLGEVTRTTWSFKTAFVISDARSGLTGTPQAPILEVSFIATVKPYEPMDTIVADISREIDLLKSFSQDEKVITVSRGQSFWTLSDQLYGTPYYYSMLAAANGVNRSQAYRVEAGKRIKAPPLYQLPLTPQVHFMKPTETIYGLCLERFDVPVGKCMSAIAKANPRLPLSHLYALEAIHLPTLPKRK